MQNRDAIAALVPQRTYQAEHTTHPQPEDVDQDAKHTCQYLVTKATLADEIEQVPTKTTDGACKRQYKVRPYLPVRPPFGPALNTPKENNNKRKCDDSTY